MFVLLTEAVFTYSEFVRKRALGAKYLRQKESLQDEACRLLLPFREISSFQLLSVSNYKICDCELAVEVIELEKYVL